ncbi:fasciclin-like arabinogalactan protein 11 [Cicer arietinum]|uniref:Fasciclin-like arabinogalactan protein 12 n=1 Tax=Cicer arietinum TaxID=3827 RepID=A0A1S3E8Z4_CICAR|nr:fasciclin-like arabinogalactan protein 12 [Cicer arietinum]
MKQTLMFSLILLLLLSPIFSITTLAQSSPAPSPKAPTKPAPTKPTPSTVPSPAPSKPLVPALPQSPTTNPDSSGNQDIIKILRKAKSFNTLIRLLKTTQIINQVNAQLVTTKNGGLTILAPDDGAFSQLKAGYFNSLGERQQKELLQYHVIPVYVSSSNFDSLSNPVLTLASDSPSGFQINVTAYGNSVNISTGVVDATITGIVYTDKTLAIYHVDKVLVPLDFVKPKAIAPAPAVAKAPKADKENSSAENDDDQGQAKKDSSDAVSLIDMHGTVLLSLGVSLLVAAVTAMPC